MCKKKQIRKQQIPPQSQYGMLEAFMINFILMIKCWLEAILTENLNKSLVQDIRYRNIVLRGKSQTKTNYTPQNEDNLDNIASNITSNII